MRWVNSRYIFKIEQLGPAVGVLVGRMNGDIPVFGLSHWEGSAIFNRWEDSFLIRLIRLRRRKSRVLFWIE